MPEIPKLVSLLANISSGATLLTFLLSEHSQVVSNGETMFFNERDSKRYDCSCGKYIDECDFYTAATQHMRLPDSSGWDKRLFAHVPTLSRAPLVRSLLHSIHFECAMRHRLIDAVPAYRHERDRFLTAQLQFFANAKALSGASVYLDGTKSIPRAQLLARDGRCDMKVLHLVRDGRGFCSSYVRHLRPTPSWIDAAKAWTRYIAWVDAFSRRFPAVPVLVVRYEDLCRCTGEVLRAICRFLDIPDRQPSIGVARPVHILGNRMRRAYGGAIVEDTAWKTTLDERTQAKLTSLMKPQLERFGYL